MKSFNSILILTTAFISMSAFAANTRKPADATNPACGSQARAEHAALIQAQDDNPGKTCSQTGSSTDGPVGTMFITYRVSFKCDENTVNYDAQTYLMGLPGKLACTSSVHVTGQFEAH